MLLENGVNITAYQQKQRIINNEIWRVAQSGRVPVLEIGCRGGSNPSSPTYFSIVYAYN